MNTLLHTVDFDSLLLERLPHLRNYPQMLPFIGKNWGKSDYRILLLGESHFLHIDSIIKKYPERDFSIDNWYNESSNGIHMLTDENYINIRKVVDQAERDEVVNYDKSLLFYYNLKKELKNNLFGSIDLESVFSEFSIYNYFQRPAFEEGISISNSPKDNEIAFSTLVEVVKIIDPRKVIFVSTKSWDAFNSSLIKAKEEALFSSLFIDFVPHASCQWWFRKAAKYGNKTGREKFIQLITE